MEETRSDVLYYGSVMHLIYCLHQRHGRSAAHMGSTIITRRETGQARGSALRRSPGRSVAMTILLDQPVVCPILVGRSAELAALQELHRGRHAWAGRCRAALGEAGIGKSRLVAELQRSCLRSWVPTPRVASASQPIAPAPMPPCLTSCARSWPLSRPHRSRRYWDPPRVRSFPCFLSRSSTCPNWRVCLPSHPWSPNRSNAASSRRWLRSSCEPRPLDRSCWWWKISIGATRVRWSSSSSSRARRWHHRLLVLLTYRSDEVISRCAPCWRSSTASA